MERPSATPLPADAFIVDAERARRAQEEFTPQVIRDEQERGEKIIESCLTDAERAIRDGDDSILWAHTTREWTPPPDKKVIY
jgi:hypothetical protein